MNKRELISTMWKKLGEKVPKSVINDVLSAFTKSIQEALKRGEGVKLVNLVTISIKQRAARKARNPATGAVLEIPEKNVTKTVLSSTIRNAVASVKLKSTKDNKRR